MVRNDVRIRWLAAPLLSVLTLLALVGPMACNAVAQVKGEKAEASKMNIKQVKSPGGISAWLVEDHNVPLLALQFAFTGGNAQDPQGKEGLANFLTAMMDEGAGELDSAEFQERMEELAMRMSFSDSRDRLYGSFATLTVNRDKAVDLLRLAVTRPRFEPEAAERVRKQLLAGLAYAERDPNRVSEKAWSAQLFPGHPYGRPANGTPASIAAITPSDLEAYRKRVFNKATLRVVAVGDVSDRTLGALLDRVFGELPDRAELAPVAVVVPRSGGVVQVIEMPIPQSVAMFGLRGPMRKDPDFVPMFVMNQILGGGGFASRLMEEVREKRGLAYSVQSYLYPLEKAGLFAGGVATKNEEIGKSLEVIRNELKRMATDGPTPTELANAKSFLTGSYALRFDTSEKIASQLLAILVEDLGIDYVDRRNAEINAVTLNDVKRVAARYLNVEDLVVTVAGQPKDLTAIKPLPTSASPRG
jgi:zinc protease